MITPAPGSDPVRGELALPDPTDPGSYVYSCGALWAVDGDDHRFAEYAEAVEYAAWLLARGEIAPR